MTLGIRREIDSLQQKMKEDIQTLKHECVALRRWIVVTSDADCSIEMDMNNRKSETRSDQKSFDLEIEVRRLGHTAGVERCSSCAGDQQQVHDLTRRPADRDRVGQVGLGAKGNV